MTLDPQRGLTSPSTRSGLARLAGGFAVLAVGLALLWQAGVLFSSDDAVVTTGSGDEISLAAADTSIETAAAEGRSVGLTAGDLAPDFEFSSFEGERMRLSDLRGQPVLLNFWATWCAPCRREMPLMETKMREYEADGLVIVAMNRGERHGVAQRFLDETEIILSVFGYDPSEDVARRYQVIYMPTSFFIDASGVITRVVPGELTEGILDSAILSALAGYPPSD